MDGRSKWMNIWMRGGRWLLLAAAMALGVLLLWQTLSLPAAERASGNHMLYDWEYTWAEKADSATIGKDTRLTGRDSPVRRFDTGNYVLLTRKIPAADTTRRLMLTTGNAPLQVTVDGQIVLDTLEASDGFAGNCVSVATLPPSSSESQLLVTMYCPYRLEFSACLIPAEQTADIDGVAIFTSTSFVAAVTVMGLVLLVMGGLFIHRPWRRQLLAAGALALFGAAACFCNRSIPTPAGFSFPAVFPASYAESGAAVGGDRFSFVQSAVLEPCAGIYAGRLPAVGAAACLLAV